MDRTTFLSSATAAAACLVASVAHGETNYAFRARLLEVHAPRLVADAAPVAADETAIDSSWRIAADSDDPVLVHAAKDLQDYFAKSMGVALSIGRGAAASKTISIGIAAETNSLASRISVSQDGIRVTGATAREAVQGCCRLEDELNARGRPAAKRGERTYTRLFSPRMTHSGYAVETFPDEYLDQLAHSGMDAILVFIEDPPDVTRAGRVDMPALVARAAARGIDVWAYASFPRKAAKMHPLDPGAREWYSQTYGSIVKNAPGLKGLICVGESCGFPSRDPGMGGYWWQENWERQGKKLNGFWPVSDWPAWLDLVKSVTREHNPDFEVVFWTYNWFKKPAELRLPLIENIPTDLTLLVTWVRGDKPVKRCGVDFFVTDYSIAATGPSAVFRSEADVAVRRGIPVMTISNTGGRTWDSGVAPYVPTPGRWKARFDALRAAQATWGVKALMESHHYGFQPNFISELAKEEFTAETRHGDFDARLAAIAVREFGASAAPAALAAWRCWDDAFAYHSTGDSDFWGPLRVGPVYPLVMPGERLPPPLNPSCEKVDGVSKGTGWKYMMSKFSRPREVLDGEIETCEREIALLEAGVRRLEAAMPEVPAEKLDGARRMLGVGKFHLASVRTLANVKRFYRAGLEKDGAAMRAVLDDEERNVREAIPVVEFDSALGWEPTMGYVADRANLEWKLRQLSDTRKRLSGMLEPFKPGSVKPGGHVAEFLRRQVAGTTGNRTKVGYPFDGCMWGGAISNVYFEEDLPYSRRIAAPREEIWWPYEQAAYFLDGMIRLSQLVDAPALKDDFKRNLEFCLASQAEDGDLFRAYSKSTSQWPIVVFFRAALAYAEETGDERVKAAFIRHYASKRGAFQHPYDRDVLNVEGMLKVAEWTGDKSYVEAAENWFERHFYFDRFTKTDRVHSHGVTFAEMMKIPALLYCATGKEKWRQMALKAMRDAFRHNETPNGQVSCCEYLSGRDPWEGSETCVAADMMCALGRFLEMDANCEAADHMERIAYNALPGAVTKDFTRHQYISLPNQAVATPFSHGGHFFYGEPDWNRFRACHFAQCCSGNVNRAMPLFAERAWMRRKSDGAPVAMLLGPGSVDFALGDGRFAISCETDYPFGDRLAYRFKCDGRLDSPFLVRVPGWSRSARFAKCGKTLDLKTSPGSLAEIPGPWKDGDVLEVEFGQPVTLETDRHWHWLRRGALTFAHPVRTRMVEERPGDRFGDLSFEDPEPFNFAFDLDEIARMDLKAERVESAYPFETPNLVVRVPMREIREWQGLAEGRFTPSVPLFATPTGRRATLDFVPYATTVTRITAFPDTVRRERLPIVRVYASPKSYEYDPSKPLALQTWDPESWTVDEFLDRGDVIQRAPDMFCDLESHYGEKTGRMAYLMFRFWSAAAGPVTCALGASKCVQAFFEGREVYSNGPIVEGRMLAPFWFKVEAKKGYNFLVVKVATPGKQVVFGQDQYRREWGAKLEVFR